jgi:hypothetical protein
VEKWLKGITKVFNTTESAACYFHLEVLTCGKTCSPDQASFVNTTNQRFRICSSFCNSLYDACRGVRIINSETRETVGEHFTTSAQFCSAVGVDDYIVEVSNSECFNGVNVTVNAATSYSFGRGIYRGMAGIPTQFKIQARDHWGNKKLIGGDLQWRVQVGPYLPQNGAITDQQDGTYAVTYTIPQDHPANYTFAVFLDQQPLQNSPLVVEYISPTHCPIQNSKVPAQV